MLLSNLSRRRRRTIEAGGPAGGAQPRLARAFLVILAAAALLAVVVHHAPVQAAGGNGSTSEAGPPAQRVVVGFEALPDELAAGDTYRNETVQDVDPALGTALVNASEPDAFAREARSDPNVSFVERDRRTQFIAFQPDDPRYEDQYGPPQVNAPPVWSFSTGGDDRNVCVADTGVRYSHEDLDGPRWLGGRDFANDDSDPWDDNGHGTHVTGTAAATIDNGKGIAGIANVGFLHAKVLFWDGSGYVSDVADGIRWCADNGGDVISLSLGASSWSSTIERAIDYARDRSSLVVAAAGNDGCNGCIGYPARDPDAIAVTCTRRDESVCGFSSTGPEAELAAPGYEVLSTWYSGDGAYERLSGTSMSTPHVSGVAALVWNREPAMAFEDVRSLLQDSAKDLGPEGRDDKYGYGLVDAGAAHEQIVPFADPTLNKSLDFDDGTPQGMSTNGPWHVDDQCSDPPSSPYYLGYHLEEGCTYEQLVRDWSRSVLDVNLSEAHIATLAFDHFWETESADADVDIMRVDARHENGSWKQIAKWNARDPNPSDWRHVNLSLGPAVGSEGQVRFVFDTVDEINNDHMGWLVDNVEVWSVTDILPAVFVSDVGEPSDADGDGVVPVPLDGSDSRSQDSNISRYAWYEDGTLLATGPTPTVNFTVGNHTVELVVTEEDGSQGNATETFSVLPNLRPEVVLRNRSVVSDDDRTGTVRLSAEGFDEPPLVLAQVQTGAGGEESLNVQALEVGVSNFTLEFCEQEGKNTCDAHGTETVGWMAFEPSVAEATPGLRAGTIRAGDSNWKDVTFDPGFDGTPAVLATTQTENGTQEALYPEVDAVDASGASVRYCEYNWDGCDNHRVETVAWLATEPGTVAVNGTQVGLAGLETGMGDYHWREVTFSETFPTTPVGFSTTQTTNGGQDPSNAQVGHVSPTGLELQHCEWDPYDSCDNHAEETSAWLAVDPGLANGRHGVAAGTLEVVGDSSEGSQYLVRLSSSSDPDGTLESYTWLLEGEPVASGPSASLDLGIGTHEVALEVTDNGGASTLDSAIVTVRGNEYPTADAGADRTAYDDDSSGNETVTLDGTGSSDPEGPLQSYEWYHEGVLVGTGPQPDVPLDLGTHEIVLNVTDNGNLTDEDTVNVTVGTNQPPVANGTQVGEASDSDGDGNATVDLDGTASEDPDGTIDAYEWSHNGSLVATGPTPDGSLPVGNHSLRLNVSDNGNGTDEGTVNVTVQPNQPPVANGTQVGEARDSDGDGEEPVDLDGTLSTDEDGYITDYEWYHEGVLVATGATPAVTLSVGNHSLRLAATDEGNATDNATVAATVQPNEPPSAQASPEASPRDHDGDGVEPVPFDGTNSSDPDGNVSGYDWYHGGALVATGPTPSIELPVGTSDVKLVVADDGGSQGSTTVQATVLPNLPPRPEAVATCSRQTCRFDASGSSDPGGQVTAYDWSFGDGTTGQGEVRFHEYEDPGSYQVQLVVTDNGSATNATEVTVHTLDHPRGPPPDPEVVDGETDPADRFSTSRWYDVESAWFANDESSLKVGASLRDLPASDVVGRPVVFRVWFTPTWETPLPQWGRPVPEASTFAGLRVEARLVPTGDGVVTEGAWLEAVSRTDAGTLQSRTLGTVPLETDPWNEILWWEVPNILLPGSGPGTVLERTRVTVRAAQDSGVAATEGTLDAAGPGDPYQLSDPTRDCLPPGRCGADAHRSFHPFEAWDEGFEKRGDQPLSEVTWNRREGRMEVRSHGVEPRSEVQARPLHAPADGDTDKLEVSARWRLLADGSPNRLIPLYVGPAGTTDPASRAGVAHVDLRPGPASEAPGYSLVYRDTAGVRHVLGSFDRADGGPIAFSVTYNGTAREISMAARTPDGTLLADGSHGLSASESLRLEEVGVAAHGQSEPLYLWPTLGALDDLRVHQVP